jgi:hypothetical protein
MIALDVKTIVFIIALYSKIHSIQTSKGKDV